ncbi:MAG: hypothetical protein ACE5I7_05985 [Candidatus Binatia bacterium]
MTYFREARWTVTLFGAALCVLVPSLARAHHILGIPHYAYDEQYPQTPVLTYRVNAGPYEVKMTGYPGIPKPGERCSLHVYIRRRDTGAPFNDSVRLTVTQDHLLGTDPVVYGPITARLEEAVYKFYPQFQAEANYRARIEFAAGDASWKIDLPMVVGQPGSPWKVLAGVAAGVVVFLVFVRAMRIKMRRKARQAARAVATATAAPGAAASVVARHGVLRVDRGSEVGS